MHLTQVSVIVLIHQLLVVLELLVVFELSLRKAVGSMKVFLFNLVIIFWPLTFRSCRKCYSLSLNSLWKEPLLSTRDWAASIAHLEGLPLFFRCFEHNNGGHPRRTDGASVASPPGPAHSPFIALRQRQKDMKHNEYETVTQSQASWRIIGLDWIR